MSMEQATEIALTINRVMKLDAQDQSYMLELITDYFTLPMSLMKSLSWMKRILMSSINMMVTA